MNFSSTRACSAPVLEHRACGPASPAAKVSGPRMKHPNHRFRSVTCLSMVSSFIVTGLTVVVVNVVPVYVVLVCEVLVFEVVVVLDVVGGNFFLHLQPVSVEAYSGCCTCSSHPFCMLTS